MPVIFNEGNAPKELVNDPNGPGKDDKNKDGKDKPRAEDFNSPGPVRATADQLPAAESDAELRARAAELNK